ncbi:hypothetical protein [Arcobacter sp.]|uniref:hypothetical protein n=1 Tax=Arcobacter sp. TaxID=1872629 RepID=UPI003D098105
MQVTNNTTVQNYNYNSTKTQEVKTSPSAFDSLLEEQKEIPKEENKGRIVTFLEKYNAFDSLSETDKNKFKEILADDKVTIDEMDSLSYEQAEKFFDYAYPLGKVENANPNEVPIVNFSNQINTMLFSTIKTNDKTLNEAMYKTAREINSDEERTILFDNIDTQLDNLNADRTLYRNQSSNLNDIDGASFILGMLQKLENYNSKNSDILLNGYSILQKNYNEVLNEKKEIYA